LKTILLIFIISLSLKADYLVYWYQSSNNIIQFNSLCVESYSLSGSYFTRTLSGTTSTATANMSNVSNFAILPDYEYKNNSCTPKTSNYNNLGLTENQFNFLSALTGLLTSILLVFVIFLKV
jgi:hypothetical protein